MSNIFNHNRLTFEFNVSRSDYWDTHLYQKEGYGDLSLLDGLQDECLIAYIDTTFNDCIENTDVVNGLVSLDTYVWEDAVNSGLELNNIGLTGVDSGFLERLVFDKDTITDEEFLDLFTNTTYSIGEGDTRFRVSKINGNNKIFSYSNEYVTEDNMNVAKLNGGFFQGFFQTDNGCEYKTLPSRLEKGWTMEFTIKPEEFELDDGSLPRLNDKYPENKGIFFYMGTRAENKWAKYYNNDKLTTNITTSDGLPIESTLTKIETDNKHFTFNRTPWGLKADMDDKKDDPMTIVYDQTQIAENYFPIMHRGKGGYNARNIGSYTPSENESDNDSSSSSTTSTDSYDTLADLFRNAFALQVTEDGKVGYKFMVKDCESETGYSISSEWSYPGMVKYDEWNTITVRFMPIVVNAKDIFGYSTSAETMRLMIYVNGKLVLYSKQLPSFMLRALADEYTKQEGVPFNISLGGGTQGLCDVIYEDYKTIPDSALYMEKEFGGSFIGYFKSFKFFNCNLNYNYINANVSYERRLIKTWTI